MTLRNNFRFEVKKTVPTRSDWLSKILNSSDRSGVPTMFRERPARILKGSLFRRSSKVVGTVGTVGTAAGFINKSRSEDPERPGTQIMVDFSFDLR
jgi:hypothetical protein